MYAPAVKSKKKNKSRAVANIVGQKESKVNQGFGFVDNRTSSRTIKNKLTLIQDSQRRVGSAMTKGSRTKSAKSMISTEKAPNRTLAIQRKPEQNVIQCNDIWEEVNVGMRSKPTMTPEEYAEGLSKASSEFTVLRELATAQTEEYHRKKLEYKPIPEKGGGMNEAYFKEGTTYFNMGGHPAMILSNIIFETANAAQSGPFLQVEADYKSKEIMNKVPSDYNITDLDERLMAEYVDGDAAKRCSIIKERFEWESFNMARPTFEQVKEMIDPKIYNIYFVGFNHMLEMETFRDYYDEYGRTHRAAVEGTLRRVAEQEKKKCYLTTACVKAQGLPDNCEELSILRTFRDKYMRDIKDGPMMIKRYYDIAPKIVKAINALPKQEAEHMWNSIYNTIRLCVESIKVGGNEFALDTYRAMAIGLEAEFLGQVNR